MIYDILLKHIGDLIKISNNYYTTNKNYLYINWTLLNITTTIVISKSSLKLQTRLAAVNLYLEAIIKILVIIIDGYNGNYYID